MADDIQWQCGNCTLLNNQKLSSCEVCGSKRPLASYALISEIEHQRKEQKKQEELALEKIRMKKMQEQRAIRNQPTNWDDNDFKDDDDAEFDDNDNDLDMNESNTNTNNNNELKTDDNDYDFDDEDGWGDTDLIPQNETIIQRHEPMKIREFEILNPYKLQNYMIEIIKSIQSLLDLDSIEHVAVLCRYYKWNRDKIIEAWLNDSDKVSKSVGLLSSKMAKLDPKTESKFFCFTCCADKNWNETYHLGCNHMFCHDCWKHYLTAQMDKGPRVVSLTRCMEPKCGKIVLPDIFDKFLSFRHKNKFQEYLLHSFVSGRKELEWCPGKDCINAGKAEFGSTITIECTCSWLWCFSCRSEAHLPVTCLIAEKWAQLCTTDKENLTWVQAYSKKCVKCKNYIEKNQGCSHMTCRCGYEFCWLCLKEWKSVGGYGHACNKPKEVIDSENEAKKMQTFLDRFVFYSERFEFNSQAVDVTTTKSLKNAKEIINNLIKTKDNVKYQDLEFIVHATDEIIRSRRILQWSFCYGYYCKDKTPQKDLFETQQTQLSSFCDQLHEKAEKVVDDPEQHQKVLDVQYRQNIIHLTKTVTNYRKNITQGLAEQDIQFEPGLEKGLNWHQN